MSELNKINRLYKPLNTILYGPPGTGKTYNSVIYAVSICDHCCPTHFKTAIVGRGINFMEVK